MGEFGNSRQNSIRIYELKQNQLYGFYGRFSPISFGCVFDKGGLLPMSWFYGHWPFGVTKHISRCIMENEGPGELHGRCKPGHTMRVVTVALSILGMAIASVVMFEKLKA